MLAIFYKSKEYIFMSNLDVAPNVYGIETEYSCTITHLGDVVYEFVGQCHQTDKTMQLYVRPDHKNVEGISNQQISDVLNDMGIVRAERSGMLSNGGRFYIDPSGPEYCTPETTTAQEAVLRTFDGDKILYGVLAALQKQDVIDSFQINRRIIDHNRSSRGIHLNTATRLAEAGLTEHQLSALKALNVTKGAIFGSGGLLLNEHGETEFHHSPRLSITTEALASFSNYTKRPLIRVPFKPDVGIKRVETVTSDALNFGWPLRASLVATNALFRLFELGYDSQLPTLRDPVKAARVVGRHGAKCMVSVAMGAREYEGMSPLSVMRDFVELAVSANETHGHLDDESAQVLEEITAMADLVEAGHDAAATQVESIARKRDMDAKMEKSKVTIGSETMCKFDFYWDKVGGGLAERKREKGAGWLGFTKNPMSVLDTRKRAVEPPKDTRARVRGAFIKIHGKDAKCHDWAKITKEDGEEVRLTPLQTKIER